jgi:hypothetical protein
VENTPPALGNLLRDQRRLRGWSLRQTVSGLRKLAESEGRAVGVNVQMLCNWESGRKQLSTLYRWLFTKLYDLPPTALGLVDDSAFVVPALVPGPTGMGWAAEDGEEPVNRRALFRHAVGLTGAAIVGSARGNGHVDPEVVRGIEELTDRYRTLYYSVDPGVLLRPVHEHFQLSEHLLGQAAAGGERDRLCRSTATTALLAGRILFFDCSTPNQARGFYDLALEAAQEGGDNLLAAAALGHMSFISASRAKPRAAVEVLAEARRLGERRRSPLVLSWLSAVEAELSAKAGEHDASLRALDQAAGLLQRPGSEPDPVWLDWFSTARLDGFAGYTNLGLERWSDAQSSLARALSAEPPGSKQRSVFLADLASTYLRQGHLDKSCELAGDALEAASQSGYATGMQRVRELHGMMRPWSNDPAVKQFTEQLAQRAA